MIRPTHTYVVVKPEKVKETTEGGIHLPNAVKDRWDKMAAYGEVMAVGPDAWNLSYESHKRGQPTPQANVGDRVMFKQGAGVSVNYGELFLMHDEDILGVDNE